MLCADCRMLLQQESGALSAAFLIAGRGISLPWKVMLIPALLWLLQAISILSAVSQLM